MPLGTIVTVCMLIGLIFSAPYVFGNKLKPLPSVLAWMVGVVVFSAGGWNTFWHGLRHLTQFWGLAALVSGIFMMLTAVCILQLSSLRSGLYRVRLMAWIGLLACFLLYALKIASM